MRNIGTKFELARGGKPSASIVNEDPTTPASAVYTAELRAAISARIGMKLPVDASNDPRANIILLGTIAQSPTVREILEKDNILIAGPEETAARASVRGLNTLFPSDMGEQGFIVYARRDGKTTTLILTANTAQGLYYAVQTIKNRIYREGNSWRIFGVGTRFLPVLNTPTFKHRSMATFISGPCFMFPGQWEREFDGDHRKFIDWLGMHKFNHLLDWSFTPDAGIGFQSGKYPELINTLHPNVRREYMPEMLRCARARHIDTWLFFKLPFRDYAMDKSRPESAPVYVAGNAGHDAGIMQHVKTAGFDYANFKGRTIRFVCLSDTRTKKFWQDYITELIERYPEIDGLGCEIGENIRQVYCACPDCKGHELELGYEYFKIMADTARAIKPSLKLWFYRAAGAELLMRRREEFPGITMIDWGGGTESWEARRARPRGDWFLYHTGNTGNAEPGIRKATGILNRYGFHGIQIRGTKYKAWESKYRAFDEFTWNPDLSLHDFAILNVLREEGRLQPDVVNAYLTWLQLVEVEKQLDDKPALPAAWLRAQGMSGQRERLQKRLASLLKKAEQSCGTSSIIRRIVTELHVKRNTFNFIAAGMDTQDRVEHTDIPWSGILIMLKNGFAAQEVQLAPGRYKVAAVLKNFNGALCRVRLTLKGNTAAEFTLDPSGTPKQSLTGWETPATDIDIPAVGQYEFRLQLATGDACACHRLIIQPEGS